MGFKILLKIISANCEFLMPNFCASQSSKVMQILFRNVQRNCFKDLNLKVDISNFMITLKPLKGENTNISKWKKITQQSHKSLKIKTLFLRLLKSQLIFLDFGSYLLSTEAKWGSWWTFFREVVGSISVWPLPRPRSSEVFDNLTCSSNVSGI